MRRAANIEGKSRLAKIILRLNLFRCAIAKIENSSWSGRLIFMAAQCNPSVAGESEWSNGILIPVRSRVKSDLMPKMADPGEDHRHVPFIRSGDHFFVAN